MSFTAAITVGELAASDAHITEVFTRLGIDFCCGGKLTVAEACREAGISETELASALRAAADSTSAIPPGAAFNHDFRKWDASFLADYIYNVHHRFIRESAPVIETLVFKVAGVHGQQHPELVVLANEVAVFLREMLDHLDMEETVLFPAIKRLDAAGISGGGLDAGNGVSETIARMEDEHSASGLQLRRFRQLTRDYTLPDDACNSYRLLFEKLKEFESDLFQHVHLENNILFAKARQL